MLLACLICILVCVRVVCVRGCLFAFVSAVRLCVYVCGGGGGSCFVVYCVEVGVYVCALVEVIVYVCACSGSWYVCVCV